MLNDRERGYIDAVCDHVRCKQAHDCIRRELGDHIEDLRDALIEQGMETGEASEAAIREMGETELVGSKMDKAYRPRVSAKLLIVFAAILALGFVFRMILGLTDAKELFCFGFGTALFLIILRFWNVGWMFDKAWWFIGIYAVLMVIAAVFAYFSGYGLDVVLPIVNGRILQIQYLQLLQPLVFAIFVWKLKGKGFIGAVASLPVVVFTLLPSLAEKNLYVFGIMGLLDLVILLYAIAKGWLDEKRWRLFVLVTALAVLLITAIILSIAPYRIWRIFHGEMVGSWSGLMTRNILENCKFFGGVDISALEAGSAAWLTTDVYRFSMDVIILVAAAKVGLWVYPVVALLMIGLIVGLARLCLREKTMLCRVMSLSIVGIFAVQFIGCFADNLGSFLCAFPMPFISYGNTSLIINMALMGMLFCILAKGWMYSEEHAREADQLKMS